MNNILNKKYELEIEVLTPLHIGAGSEKDWMEGADFIQKNGKIYKLNHKKLEKKIDVDTLSDFLIKKDSKGLANKISGNIEEVSEQIFENPVSSTNDIKAFIKNGLSNKPIIPGSSVKGAIRSVLLQYFGPDKNEKDARNLEKKIFGSSTDGDEFMRFIKISDAQFEKTELVNTKIFNLFKDGENWKGGWKHKFKSFRPNEKTTDGKFQKTGFNTIYEIICPKEHSRIRISLADKALDNLIKIGKFDVSEKKKEIIYNNNIENSLFSIINYHTKKYINKEISFFEKYANNETDKIIDSLNSILNKIPDDNSICVLKMSAGSGFHSITGDWRFDDFDYTIHNPDKLNLRTVWKNGKKIKEPTQYKSRKIATDGNKFELMGFVKLIVLSDKEIARRQLELQQKLEAEQKEKKAKIKAEQEEKERAEADRLAKIEAKRKADQERIAEEKRIEEERLALIRKKEEELKTSQEKNIAINAEKTVRILDEGLSAIKELNDFNRGKIIIEQYFKTQSSKFIEGENAEILKYFIHNCIAKNNKRWKKFPKQDWTLVIKWLGKPTAQKWFDEIIKH